MTKDERFAQDLIQRSLNVKVSVFDQRKRKLFTPITGTVLEIGAGADVNLKYFPKTIRWIGVEPNEGFHAYLKTFLSENGFQGAEVFKGGAEHLPLPDASVDAVVSTQVLCSVSDVAKALAEIKRVLKPGGVLYFMEHVAAKGAIMRLWQAIIKRWYLWRSRGCCVDREILAAIKMAGFHRVDAGEFVVGRILPDPYIAGVAIK